MRIGLLGCKWTTVDLLDALDASGVVSVDVVVTLDAAAAAGAQVAGSHVDELLARARGGGRETYVARSYPLADPSDREFFAGAGIDVLLVIGWERLVPPEVLDSLGTMACGMHGSAYGLPRGRGRSPLNWSLITDRRRFVTSLFRYDPGVDAGDVLASRTFEINDFDTIESLHIKNRIAMQQLVEGHVARLAQGAQPAVRPQADEEPSYYPRRRPEDSAIDWARPTREIYNLIRAVTAPYPSAFCDAVGNRLEILEAFPFDGDLFASSVAPGTVVDVSRTSGTFVVKTVDGSLHVRRFGGVPIEMLQPGTCLGSVDSRATARAIAARYPADVPTSQHELRWDD